MVQRGFIDIGIGVKGNRKKQKLKHDMVLSGVRISGDSNFTDVVRAQEAISITLLSQDLKRLRSNQTTKRLAEHREKVSYIDV